MANNNQKELLNWVLQLHRTPFLERICIHFVQQPVHVTKHPPPTRDIQSFVEDFAPHRFLLVDLDVTVVLWVHDFEDTRKALQDYVDCHNATDTRWLRSARWVPGRFRELSPFLTLSQVGLPYSPYSNGVPFYLQNAKE